MREIAIVSVEWDVVDLLDTLPDCRIAGFIDRPGAAVGDLPLLGDDEDWPQIREQFPGIKAVLGIDPPHIRRRIFERFGGESVIGLVSPNAHLGRQARVGEASIVQRGVTVMPRASIGTACKINVNATVHHDCAVGDFCTLAPGSHLLGNVRLGRGVYVGAGAIIRQRCQIGDGAVIGAGAVVVGDVPARATVVGVPANRRLR